MWTGQQTLKSINDALRSASHDIERLDNTLSELTTRQAENRRDQAKICEGLASLRLDHISRDQTQSILSDADSLALDTLAKRAGAIDELEKSISLAKNELLELESSRDRRSLVVDERAQLVIECEYAAQLELEDNDAYQQQLEKTQRVDAVAYRAEEKTALAEHDRVEKGKPFESDKLFMYLWHRNFGQVEYKANFFIRFLDNWVARLCDYHQSRLNYWMLLELPKRLTLHAESVRSVADAELLELQKIEHSFAEKHGVVKAQEELSEHQELLNSIDDQIELAENKQNKLLLERTAFNAGEDPYYKQAIYDLTKTLQRKDIVELQRLANRTLDRQDDYLIANMLDLQEEEKELQLSIGETRQQQQTHLEKLNELKQVRIQFKRRHFDDVRSGFTEGGLISIALNEFLKGVLNNGELWRVIERSQRHRDVGAWPDFGGGGLGRPGGNQQSSPWHWPGGKRGGGFRLPRSGGSSSRGRGSGGFRTGGGF